MILIKKAFLSLGIEEEGDDDDDDDDDDDFSAFMSLLI
jgi:hypothetical protein